MEEETVVKQIEDKKEDEKPLFEKKEVQMAKPKGGNRKGLGKIIKHDD